MRLEVCRTAVVLAILFSVLGSFAASPPTKPEPAPAVRSGSISDALCGRESEQRVRAEALDRVDPRVLSEAWRKLKVADVDLWLVAPICLHATSTEAARFENRHGALGRLRSRVERACTTEFVEASLARFRGWKPRPDGSADLFGVSWLRCASPGSGPCGGGLRLPMAGAEAGQGHSDWFLARHRRTARASDRRALRGEAFARCASEDREEVPVLLLDRQRCKAPQDRCIVRATRGRHWMPRSIISLDFFLYDNRTWSPRWGRDWGLKAATGGLADRADLKSDFDRYCGAMPGGQGQLRGFGAAIGA